MVYFECSTEEYCYSPNYGFGLNEGHKAPQLTITGQFSYDENPLEKIAEWCKNPPIAKWIEEGQLRTAIYNVMYVFKVNHQEVAWIDVTGDKPDRTYYLKDGEWLLNGC